MKEQIISFETAKLAKEKGFFIKGIKTLDCEDGCIQTFGYKINKEEYLSGKLKDLSNKNVFILETQSLLQKWLREKHNIHTAILPWDSKTWWYQLENLLTYDEHGCLMGESNTQYNSYEEALEIALQESLKVI